VNFDLDETQEVVRDLATQIFAGQATTERVKAVERADGFDHELWRELAAANLLGLCLPADHGGSDMGVVEMALTEVVSVREKARASARSAPPPRVRSSEWPLARPGRKDPTVRIVWVGGEPTLEPSGRSAPPRAASLESKAPEAAATAPEAAAKAPEAAAKAPEAAAKAPEAAAKAPEAAKSSDTPASPSERRPPGLADADEGSTTALVLAVGFLAVVLLIGFLLTR
jgi:hypothetical protein